MGNKSKVIGVLSIVLFISLLMNIKSCSRVSPVLQDNSQRDSLINYQKKENAINANYWHSKADSLQRIVLMDLKKDSIREVNFKKKVVEIHHFTPEKRNQMYDSLFGPSL